MLQLYLQTFLTYWFVTQTSSDYESYCSHHISYVALISMFVYFLSSKRSINYWTNTSKNEVSLQRLFTDDDDDDDEDFD